MKESLSLHDKKPVMSGVVGGDAGLADKKLAPVTPFLPCPKNPLQPIENTIAEPKMLSTGGGGGERLPPRGGLLYLQTTMSISTSPSTPELTRICLVGPVAQDAATLAAAQSLKLPIVTSDTGAEYAGDDDSSLSTVFVLNDFEGPVYDALLRTKQRILGPPALQQAVRFSEGLVLNNRPIYNYCMRGVITCFTGIRKKDELTHLVHLIHSMGGSIRKEMNTKVTHLICNSSGGEKYRYAMTFRLAIIRPNWVLEAWKHRNEVSFTATSDTFTALHRVKAFDGQKVCFFGFPEEEQQDMINLLKKNGGIPTDLEDPECSHVVMGAHFNDPSTMPVEGISPKKSPSSSPAAAGVAVSAPGREGNGAELFDHHERHGKAAERHNQADGQLDNSRQEVTMELDACAGNNDVLPALPEEENESTADVRMAVGDNVAQSDACIGENGNTHRDQRRPPRPMVASPSMQFIDEEPECEADMSTTAAADKLSKRPSGAVGDVATPTPAPKHDGVVLTSGEANEFLNPNNISPILKSCAPEHGVDESFRKIDENADEDEDEDDDVDDYVIASREAYKRKRVEDSFDDPSLLSVDISIASNVAYGAGSAKKPKLTRTGSITRGIRRSMSFAAIKTPIKSMLRSRRSSVDPNASTTSITLLETTFNESIKKPVKEKLRSIRDKITKTSKKDTPKSIKSKGLITSANLDSLKKVCNFKSTQDKVPNAGMHTPEQPKTVDRTEVDFKTPVAPVTGFGGTGGSSSKMVTRSRGKLTGIYALSKVGPVAASEPGAVPQRHSIATIGGGLPSESTMNQTVPDESMLDDMNHGGAVVAASTTICEDAEMMPVVYEHVVQTKPETKNKNTHIVKADWFWYTIQSGYANEVDYLFADYLNSIAQTPVVDRRDSLPVSFNKRKRKRLSQRTPAGEGTPLGVGKRRSSVSDAGLLSVSGSFLDCTTSPDKHESSKKNIITEASEASNDQPTKTLTMRQNHFMDFFHTESNYVGILDTIVKLFKEPLEEMVEGENALLNKSELRSVFGNFLPIHDVHKRMLDRLKEIHGRWSEDVLIGQIVLDHRDDLLKAYPPYVNFFEQMKETLLQCDAANPRFHAFLKINQAKPECGRQTLQELMIRPVQRLPSISLLLNDILKHTAKTNPDSKKLDEALKAIKEVMTYINEDKRKTEGQMAMFDIFNDIDNCPPHLVSSHRSFVSRCEVTELSDSLSGRGDPLVLFLFSDTLEVCKKRTRVFNSVKSPNTNSLNLTRSSCATTKPYKHVKLMPLSTIRLVVNIVDSPRAFILICRELSQNAKDRQYSFNMADEEQDKLIYLKSLSKQMAENACRTDTGHFLINSTSEEVDIDVSDVNVGTLSKAFKFASKTRIRVGRAFSFNKTPSKLKRAVSTMMTSQFGSTQSLTPASQLAQMKLASCTNLNEVGEEAGASGESSPSSSKALVAPMSVQPTRKNKNPPISIGTLRPL
ncbi:protein ECT2 isoform X2 [Anopheles ziemanni]|uniref:protein ECT2 isoform X2 n=1 Tax=Anopheles coustani TaxID=139045 RepID=UPI002658C88C|nr:protein ECT2 isoform X2 [Anopheles coustani]XP_058167915.1 protein ECT2 isoform X2 [Anopheles ziemanni]